MFIHVLARTMSTDKEHIDRLGGSAKVAQMLGYTVQRVQNWKDRGIPAREKLAHPEMFLIPMTPFARRKTDRQADKKSLVSTVSQNHNDSEG